MILPKAVAAKQDKRMASLILVPCDTNRNVVWKRGVSGLYTTPYLWSGMCEHVPLAPGTYYGVACASMCPWHQVLTLLPHVIVSHTEDMGSLIELVY